jgi:hypothetical protein
VDGHAQDKTSAAVMNAAPIREQLLVVGMADLGA